MTFDKDKVLTPFTADKAKKGDWGWGADGPNALKDIVGKEVCLRQLDDVVEGSYPFVHIKGDYTFNYRYFYPAPYKLQQEKWVEENKLEVGDKVLLTERLNQLVHHDRGFHKTVDDVPVGTVLEVTAIREDAIIGYVERVGKLLIGYVQLPYFAIMKHESTYNEQQAQWVKENNVKVGDSVYVKRSWKKGEGGFAFVCDVPICQRYKVTKVCDDGIEVKREPKVAPMGGVCYAISPAYHALPYFAIEKVEYEYRPFANAEEFKPHRDEWFSWTGGFEEEAYRVTAYGDDYVELGGERISYEQFSKQWRFATTGEPAGVKV